MPNAVPLKVVAQTAAIAENLSAIFRDVKFELLDVRGAGLWFVEFGCNGPRTSRYLLDGTGTILKSYDRSAA